MTESSAQAARPIRKRWVFAALAAVALVAAGGALIKALGNEPVGPDQWWFDHVGAAAGSQVMAVAQWMHVAGDTPVAASIVIAVILAMLVTKRWRDAASMATAGLIGILASDALKALFERPRPPEPFVIEYSFAYPSGHSMGAAMIAVSLALIISGAGERTRGEMIFLWVLAAGWVLTMMWSRTIVHAHWLTDTLGGALLGAAAAVLARGLCYGAGFRRNIAKDDETGVR